MQSPAKLSKRTTVTRAGNDGWGMGFLLVFFPQENHHHHHHHHQQPGLDSIKSPTIKTLLRRSPSTQILPISQPTISLCLLFIFFTLLLFTLCSFQPNHNISHNYRRHLSQSHSSTTFPANRLQALQRLGTLYSRGTKPMNDLLLCHVPDSVTLTEMKSFLRAFHRSGLFSKSDLVFIFPSVTTPEFYDNVIREENQAFITLIRRFKAKFSNRSEVKVSDFPASFDFNQFVKPGNNNSSKGEPIWGRKVKNNVNSSSGNDGGSELTELTRTSYGSVVGFGVGELDPENSLSGFMDHVPISLRRWASYPMILGRVRRNYKHVVLVDVKEVLLVGDLLAGVRNTSPESVFLYPTTTRHDHNHKAAVTPSVIMGGGRGVRRLSAAMLTEIVRQTTHKNGRSFRLRSDIESTVLNRLVTSDFVKKNVNIVASDEPIPEASASSLGGVGIANNNKVVRRGNSNNLDIELRIRICSFTIEASVYTECGKVQLF